MTVFCRSVGVMLGVSPAPNAELYRYAEEATDLLIPVDAERKHKEQKLNQVVRTRDDREL